MSDFRSQLPHLIIQGTAQAEAYTSTNSFPRPKYPARNRVEHATYLLSQIKALQEQKIAKEADGIFLEIESTPAFDLAIKSLASHGIELLNVKQIIDQDKQKTVAAIFIPDEKIQIFIKKIEDYRDKETKKGNPKNNSLITSINNIRYVILKSLWTDVDDLFPRPHDVVWWEIWLRDNPEAILRFSNFAKLQDISVSTRIQKFPDRYVVLAYTTAEKLSDALESLGFIAEVRKAKEATADFLQMRNHEQQEWVDSLLSLVDAPDQNNVTRVCILDTGIAKQHPLISQFLPENSMHTCDPDWDNHDHDGHGTAMAGLTLYGDLSSVLLSKDRITVPCYIESVKILPPNGNNEPNLYGNITEEAVSLVTITAPFQDRIICMAVTSIDGRDQGQPTSWSASIDNISVGETILGKKHLVVISSGNTDKTNHINYPDSNLTDSIHDPGQSWNALTVGAYTEKVHVTDSDFVEWSPLAEAGDIAPANTTSLTWKHNKWPIKPDIVFEGGNAAIDPKKETIDYPNDLSLLSTNLPQKSMFTYMADTSAAAAQIAHMAAVISNKYPRFWPETIRGLIIHTSNWTDQMKKSYLMSIKQERERLLRICGYGVPNLNEALWSASNSLTLIVQDELKPYKANTMNELHLHTLPWPTNVLQSLGKTTVKMRVTLSYFIEPNPARRGWEHKFRYQSHGLRFDVKTAEETDKEFITRINKKRWDEELGAESVTSIGDSAKWYFGERIRSKGSLHSDIWEGAAVNLASRNQIVVYPVTGWWREMHSKGHANKKARYSLIVTISTPEITADIYTPVETVVMEQVAIQN